MADVAKAATATTALVVATRAAVGRCNAGRGDTPLLPGGHQARRLKGPEDCHQRWWEAAGASYGGGRAAGRAFTDGTDGYVAALVPSLSPLLAGAVGEAVDDTALSYLLQQSLSGGGGGEGEAAPLSKRARITAILNSSTGKRKKRKKKAPKTSSSRHSCVRIRRCGYGYALVLRGSVLVCSLP